MSRRTGAPLRLHVADLLRRSGSRREVELDVVLGGLEVSASRVPEGAPVHLDLHLESVPKGIVLPGRATARGEGECRRCLRPVTGSLVVRLQEVFEDDPVEGETWPLTGDQIDVGALVREAVTLDLPLAPLCEEECQGLCPECGADRNEADCGHAVDTSDPRWQALDSLRFDN